MLITLDGMNKIILICLVMALSGCKTVRQEDLDAWRGAPLSDLETHALLNSIPVEVRQISGGRFLYIYTNSATTTTPIQCQSGRTISGVGRQTQCYGGNERTFTCSNQFITNSTHVLQYIPVGDCYTDCSIRPFSRPCLD